MRPICVLIAIAGLCACGSPPPARTQAGPDPANDIQYTGLTADLTKLAREARAQFDAGRLDDAAKAIERARPLQTRALEVPRPTLAAMEAASDLDDVYGRMLLQNGHISWARDMFQKNVVRWKTWKPQTPETERRWKAAVEAVTACDRRLM